MSASDILLELLVPRGGVERGKPVAEGQKLITRELADGSFDFVNGAHVGRIIASDFMASAEAPNDPKLSDRGPEARVCAKRREAKARHVLGFMAGAHAVTEPVERSSALR